MSKPHGTKFEFERERAKHLLQEYRDYLSSHSRILNRDMYAHIVNCRSPRFWVTNTRATIVMSDMLKGRSISHMRRYKREMYYEIFRRVCAMLRRRPAMNLLDAVSEVICQAAPKYYMSPESAKVLIYNERKRIRWELKRK